MLVVHERESRANQLEDKMRKLIVFVMILGMAANAAAVVKKPIHRQPPVRSQETRVEKTHIGLYVTPVLKIGEVRQEVRGLIGIRGGLEINHSFYVGLAGYGLPEENQTRHWGCDECNDDVEWEMGYGGLEFGVMAGTPRTGLLSMGVLIGGGGVSEDRRYVDRTESFFVLEPQLDLSVTLARNVRLSIGGGYRFIDDLNSLRYTEDDLEGPTFNIGVAVGIF
jgi:hypothetical protein